MILHPLLPASWVTVASMLNSAPTEGGCSMLLRDPSPPKSYDPSGEPGVMAPAGTLSTVSEARRSKPSGAAAVVVGAVVPLAANGCSFTAANSNTARCMVPL